MKGWNLPTLSESTSDETFMKLYNLTPYWLSREEAVSNTLVLDSIYLLSAPNMSGKSTLMRSVLVAALLGNCGLFAPISSGSNMCRYDNFFLRTASYDVPSTGMSSFALEMDDLRVILRDCSHRSLIMVDELGRGKLLACIAHIRIPISVYAYVYEHIYTGIIYMYIHILNHKMNEQALPRGMDQLSLEHC